MIENLGESRSRNVRGLVTMPEFYEAHQPAHEFKRYQERVDLFGIYIKLFFSLQRSKHYFIIPHTERLSGLPTVTLRADSRAWISGKQPIGPSA